MTIEALLTSIDNRLAVLATLLGNEGDEAAAVAPAATAPARRGRGRPAADDPKPATTAAPAATTVAPVQQAAAPEVDPFDEAPAPVVPVKKVEKADARAALEAFRLRLKGGFVAIGDDDATAQNKATTRALAWLKEVTGHSTLATMPEDQFATIVTKAPAAK